MIELECIEILVKDAEWVAAALLELGGALCSVVLCRKRPSTYSEAKITIFDRDRSVGTHVGRPRAGDEVVKEQEVG